MNKFKIEEKINDILLQLSSRDTEVFNDSIVK